LAIGFSSCGLIAGMIRPEGVFFAAFLLLMIVARLGWRRSIVIITCFVGVFGVFGGIYFLWRWSYFGYPLPNPFYRKGGGSLYPEGLRASILNVLQMGLPFLLLYIPAWVQKRRRRLVITALIPVIGFTLIWVLLSDEMNFGGRFQYPVLPIILCVCCVLNMPPLLSARPRAWGMVGMILMLCYGLVFNRATYGADGRYDIGRRLARYEGYTIATSEAGLVPFYSGWRTVDTWGLNDQWIAHNGGVTAEYLDRVQPQIVMFHRFSYPTTPAWDRMIATLQGYVERRKYVLAARYGVHPSDTHDYYVRADLPDSEAMIAAIRDINYIWFNTGTSAMNFVPDR
jgi:arabinofuranosyltransferase